ncbi:SAP domain-containing protein [uncultured Desulfuromusa sp.]|uniref:SAP domain-containing protein n=1 Tax=uncultured Desulfuromusa sp. TaxID=219183 RepID=UPI002AA8B12B|nr:SAP domain-containing protein [uncultured Desulfuromusa sp.]
MNMTEVKAVAKDRGVKPGKMKKEVLIRRIQEIEGNPQCFNTSFSEQCGQIECIWRNDCV